MDIYLNLSSGTFALDFDEEDETPDWKTRFMLVNAAWQRPWPQRKMRQKEPNTFGSFEYDHLIEVDGVELSVSSTLPREATLKMLQVVTSFLLEKVKSGDPVGSEEFEDEQDEEEASEEEDGDSDGGSEEAGTPDE